MAAPINPQAYSHYVNLNNGTYQYPYQQPMPAIQKQGIIFVGGINEAQSYPVAPGNTVILMDSNESVFYIKTSESLRVFDYTERIQNGTNNDYVSREEFEELKKMLDDLTK